MLITMFAPIKKAVLASFVLSCELTKATKDFLRITSGNEATSLFALSDSFLLMVRVKPLDHWGWLRT